MIDFEKFTLGNGLTVIVHEDHTTPLAVVNIMYDVGARDENPDKTGFAHLFEHLMFGGSVNIPKYDEPLQNAGGENNAFTNNDITNYYCTLPALNIETAFWLESDRMLDLAFTPKSLDVQRDVVVEEFRQSYLNQPYGDVWLLLRPLAYKVHPYLWSTIGKDIAHIRNAAMSDVVEFYRKYYNPENAILCVAGNIKTARIKELAEKWFGTIGKRGKIKRSLPVEPVQEKPRSLSVERAVPYDAIYRAYHMCSRRDEEFYASDLLSDILSNGDSSRLYQNLVKEKKLFSSINAYVTGGLDKGLFVIEGKLIKGITMDEAEKAINDEILKISTERIDDRELQKVKNKVESQLVFSEMNILSKAINLSFAELLGDASLVNKMLDKYKKVRSEDINKEAAEIFNPDNCSTLYYMSKN